MGMNGDTVVEAGQVVNQPCKEGGMGGVVGVDMLNALSLHEPAGRHRLGEHVKRPR